MPTRYQRSRKPLRDYLTTYANDTQRPDSRGLKPRDNYIGRHRADVMLLARSGIHHLPLSTHTARNSYLLGQHIEALLDDNDKDITHTATRVRHDVLDSQEPGGSNYRGKHFGIGSAIGFLGSTATFFGFLYLIFFPPQDLDITLASAVVLAFLICALVVALPFIGAGASWLVTYPVAGVRHRKAIAQFNEPIDATRKILATRVEALDTTSAGHAGQRVRLLQSDLANLDLRVRGRSEYSMYLTDLHELWMDYEKLTAALVTFADTHDYRTRKREDTLITETAEALIRRCARLDTLVGQTRKLGTSDDIAELAAHRGAQDVQAINSQMAQDMLRAQLLDPASAKTITASQEGFTDK